MSNLTKAVPLIWATSSLSKVLGVNEGRVSLELELFQRLAWLNDDSLGGIREATYEAMKSTNSNSPGYELGVQLVNYALGCHDLQLSSNEENPYLEVCLSPEYQTKRRIAEKGIAKVFIPALIADSIGLKSGVVVLFPAVLEKVSIPNLGFYAYKAIAKHTRMQEGQEFRNGLEWLVCNAGEITASGAESHSGKQVIAHFIGWQMAERVGDPKVLLQFYSFLK